MPIFLYFFIPNCFSLIQNTALSRLLIQSAEGLCCKCTTNRFFLCKCYLCTFSTSLHIMRKICHIRKVQNGAAYSVQLVDNYPAYLAFAYLAKELLKFGPVGILAGITLVFENPATAAFQLILAEINLALNADTVLAVYGLSCINYIFSDIHVGLLSCGMELPTYKYIIPLIAPKDNVVDGQAGVSLALLYLLNTS